MVQKHLWGSGVPARLGHAGAPFRGTPKLPGGSGLCWLQTPHGPFPCFAEELDTLIGDRGDQLRSALLCCSPAAAAGASLPRQRATPGRPLGEPPVASGVPQPLPTAPAPGALHVRNPLPSLLGGQQAACYASPQGFPPLPGTLMPQSRDPQSLFPPGEARSEPSGQPSITQDSPLPAQTPPMCGGKVLEPPAARTVQDSLLQEGDLSNDIDALNPSLTDFDLQGTCLGQFWVILRVMTAHPNLQPMHLCPFFTSRPGHCYRETLWGFASVKLNKNPNPTPDITVDS